MFRGYSYLQSSGVSGISKSGIARAVSTIAVGMVLSGCVATALTPIAGTPSPALNTQLALAPQGSDVASSTDVASDSTGQPIEPSVAASGVTIPVKRPGLAGDPPQLALAASGTASIAAQKAETVAQANGNIQKQNTSISTSVAPVVASTAPPKKKSGGGFFASLFNSNKTLRPKRTITGSIKTKPQKVDKRKVAVFRPVSKGVLPGVRKLGLFGIYDAKEGASEGYDNSVRMASIGGLARTSPNGLRIQRPGVQVACLRPGLVRIIKQVQRRYGRVPIVTSGYRSPSANRRARGARNSMHIYCKAADIQVTGVSKWALAKYLRSIPGRGGVGTYCHTKSVHIDIGSKRDWNWRCRRGKRVAKRG